MVVMDEHLANGGAVSTLTVAADRVDSASAYDSTCDVSEVRHWRAALESRWTRALEEIIVLSRACAEAWQASADDTADPVPVSLARLNDRTELAYQDLADIGAAIDKLHTGSFGICEGCERPMPPDWLADEPQVPRCPDCSLRMVRWRPTPVRTAVTRTRTSARDLKSADTIKSADVRKSAGRLRSAGALKSDVPASAAGQPSHRERRLSVVAN
jgi:DnaK suppressor protein